LVICEESLSGVQLRRTNGKQECRTFRWSAWEHESNLEYVACKEASVTGQGSQVARQGELAEQEGNEDRESPVAMGAAENIRRGIQAHQGGEILPKTEGSTCLMTMMMATFAVAVVVEAAVYLTRRGR
jgi:hypothetical protein